MVTRRKKKEPTEKPVNLKDLAREVSNAVWAACVGPFEKAEFKKLIYGNGHHMAQNVAKYASDYFLARDRKKLDKIPDL